MNRIAPHELRGYGTIAGKRTAADERLIDVSLIIEKPDVAVAREKLRVDGLPDDTFLGWFGMHLLAPSIYDILEEMVRDDVRDGGEFQLTRAQEIQRQRHGYLALEMTDASASTSAFPTTSSRACRRSGRCNQPRIRASMDPAPWQRAVAEHPVVELPQRPAFAADEMRVQPLDLKPPSR